MFVPYEKLSDEARVWVYPSSRKFYPQELEELQQKLHEFVINWRQGDEDFKASYQFLHQRFLVFLVEEDAKITNQDIDTLVAFIFKLQEDYEVELLDKMNVCFKQGAFVQYKDVKAFKKLLKNKSVSDKTVVFDHLIQTKYDLENYWEVPITDSWYNRFL